MNQQSYQSLTNWFYQRPILNKILVSCCRLFPYSMFFLYAVGSVCLFSHFLFYGFDAEYLLFWIIPAAGFVLVSLLRKKINAPRPYDLFYFTPLIGHESGASFPSRHTACAFLIFSALLWIFLHNLFPISLVILSGVLALLTGASRILAGLHFPKDVFCGALFSLVFSAVFYPLCSVLLGYFVR